MLTAFRDQKGAEVPLAFDSSGNLDRLMYAWETVNDFLNENGTVEYGYLRPGYKDFLIQMNKWFADGLLDNNYPTSTRDILNTNIRKNRCNLWFRRFLSGCLAEFQAGRTCYL